MKKYKTTIIITTLITLLPIVIGLFLWNKLPDTLATHWGSDGTANGWSSKTFSVFGMPLILTAIHVLCLFVTLNDPKKKNIHKKPMALIFSRLRQKRFYWQGIRHGQRHGFLRHSRSLLPFRFHG